MARYIRYLVFVAVLALWLAPGAALAGNYDMPQGTRISNSCTITFSALADSLVSTLGGDTYVQVIIGDTLVKPTETGNGNFGETVTYTYYVFNTGNSSDTVSIQPVISYGGGATNWRIPVGNQAGDSHTNVIASGGAWPVGDSIIVGPMAEDGMGIFIVQVGMPAGSGGGNDNGDTCFVRLNVNRSVDSAATGQYTGDNAKTYAEANYTFGFDTTTIAGAIFTVTKSGTCALAGVQGPARPGYTIQYRIHVVNSGTGIGTNVTIYDEIDTSVVSFNTGTAAAGWQLSWAPANQTDFSYAAAGWTVGAPGATARWIRFNNASVAAAAQASHFYTVIIR